MGAANAVIFSTLWLKQFEPVIAADKMIHNFTQAANCGARNRVVIKREYSIQCKTCCLWFHRGCSPFSVQGIKMSQSEWLCGCSLPTKETSARIIASCVGDIISARVHDIPKILEVARSLHPNLLFIKDLNHRTPRSWEKPFLDISVLLENGTL